MTDILALTIARIDFLRGREKQVLYRNSGDVGRLCAMSLVDIARLVGRVPRVADWDSRTLAARAERDAAALEGGAFKVVLMGSEDYPELLGSSWDPPFLLYYRGTLPPESGPRLAIVGTRRPSEAGRYKAWEAGRDCADLGIAVVSGLAHGIDGAAHAGCVSYGGYSVAVMGCGIDRIHPVVHRRLAASLLDAGGCLLSEYGPGTEVRKYHFPVRNRIISGLCRGVLIVEAPVKSGALITAQYSLDTGREVFVHAAGCGSIRGSGTAALADNGARVIRNVYEISIP